MKLFTTQEIKSILNETLKNEGLTIADYIERSALGIAAEIKRRWKIDKRIFIYAGPYENGALSLATAKVLHKEGYQINIILFNVPSDPINEECRRQRDQLLNSGFLRENLKEIVKDYRRPEITEQDLIIDGIFGSELNRSLEAAYTLIIEQINSMGAEVISLDVPSGMSGDFNPKLVPKKCIKSNLTLSIQFPHLVFFLPGSQYNISEWKVIDIGLSTKAANTASFKYLLIGRREVTRTLPERNPYSSKADYGTGIIYAGSYGMIGAAVMAALGALRSGIGKLTVSTPICGFPIVQSSVPEALYKYTENKDVISRINPRHNYDSVAIGPGISTHEVTVNALEEFLSGYQRPVILDADALNCIARKPVLLNKLAPMSILTPHAGEFDRLFGEHANGDSRILKSIEMSRTYNIIIILKGHHTVITLPDGKIMINSTGTPALATPGSGDVLTGILTSMLAQLKDPVLSAMTGVYLHGRAGELAEEELGSYGVLASDISKFTAKAIKEILDS
ncbi:MAG: NAD(P)H-hydrate dehydratase [Muribaculaceae bacterium]|nr:NAD(P)H-hydrate dehydratase [Muribaculaceae bacterium]